jgi:hypothetical protein
MAERQCAMDGAFGSVTQSFAWDINIVFLMTVQKIVTTPIQAIGASE